MSQRRTGLIVGLAVGAAVLLLGGVVTVAVLAGSSGGTAARDGQAGISAAPSGSAAPAPAAAVASVRPPGSAAGYKQSRGAEAQRAVEELRQELSSAGSARDGRQNAKIALYTKGLEQLVFIGYSGAESPQLAEYLAHSPAAEVSLFFQASGVTGLKDHPAGTPDAVLRCGTYEEEGQLIPACAWADRSALISLTGTGLSTKELAALTLKFRAVSVHRSGSTPS